VKRAVKGVVVINSKRLVLPCSKQGKGHYLPILEAIVGQMDAMLSHHGKVLIFRQDLHLHAATRDNAVMSGFIHLLRARLDRRGFKRVGFVWCREQDRADAQHYHCAFIVNANVSRHPHRLIELIEELWELYERGTAYTPKRCYEVVRRGDQAAYERQFKRLSYLAKVATKGQRAKGVNDYSASRVKGRR